MTDYSELVERMRAYPANRLCIQVADALEAQAKEIAKLRSDLRLHAGDCASLSNELDLMREQRNIADVENEELNARIAELEWTVEELRRQARSMSDYTELLKRLRERPHRRAHETTVESQERRQKEREDAADALEVQGTRISVLEAENKALREALDQLNGAVDAFWNDPERPSITKMRSSSVVELSDAQTHARAVLKENSDDC